MRKEFVHLLRIMPLGVALPVMSALTVDLPPGGGTPGPGWRPFSSLVTIESIHDRIDLMASMQVRGLLVLHGYYCWYWYWGHCSSRQLALDTA